jgi:hypothetical protein
MDNEPAANLADPDVVTPEQATALGQTEAITPAGGEGDDLDQLTKEALGETDATPEFVEIEVDGRKYKVASADDQPLDPDVKPGILRDADYRKKTMTLSEERKALQTEREAFAARANLEGEAALRARDLAALDAEIREYSQISVAALKAQGWTDDQIRQAQAELKQRQGQRDDLARQVSSDVAKLNEGYETEFRTMREKARSEAQLANKALTPERIEKLEEFAISEGIGEKDARSITDPTAYKLLHLAEIGKQFIERQTRAAQLKAAAQGAPATTLGGKAAGGKSPEEMGPEEMAAHLGYRS